MVKSLASKVAPWVFAGLGLIGSGCAKTYNIDGNKVTDYRKTLARATSNIYLKEEKPIKEGESNKLIFIKYFYTAEEGFCKLKVKKREAEEVFSKRYVYRLSNPRDSTVINTSQERLNYLKHKLDSIMVSERTQKIAMKEAKRKLKEQKRIDFGLRAFGK